ncbi:diguanylate cyclase [Roseomonas sp. NAR14]|uniref:diguanylate cyclase n=1 Tax=Roseomonas acroporae TaxID=2937791 RepID=A0A9X2BXP9_9PROT|nr:sensor domain-containing diguanylate cyclase [Roseomonas acroporae]MCK8785190.1 diguanylate cyclase [Roseomonas acroporae]
MSPVRPDLGLQLTADPDIAPDGPRVIEAGRSRGPGASWSSLPFSLEGLPLLEEALRAVPQAVMVTDRQMRMIFTNSAYTGFFGLPPELSGGGAPVQPAIDAIAASGEYGPGPPDRHASFRKAAIRNGLRFQLERRRPRGGHLLVAGCPLDHGGYLTLITDLSVRDAPSAPVELLAEVEALRAENRALAQLATTDPLLGIPNRRGFARLAGAEHRRLRRERDRNTVLLLDIDHFKSINDTHGHASGDAVLRRIARTLQATLRPGDHLARHGGEEFAVLLPRTGLERGQEMAEALRLAVAETPVALPAATLRVAISGGVTEWAPDEGIDEALARADRHLYVAKQSGRNRMVAA